MVEEVARTGLLIWDRDSFLAIVKMRDNSSNNEEVALTVPDNLDSYRKLPSHFGRPESLLQYVTTVNLPVFFCLYSIFRLSQGISDLTIGFIWNVATGKGLPSLVFVLNLFFPSKVFHGFAVRWVRNLYVVNKLLLNYIPTLTEFLFVPVNCTLYL